MIYFLFRVLLSFSATSWMLAVYLIKTHTSFLGLPMIVAALIYIIILSLIAFIALQLTRRLEKDEVVECLTFDLADNEFLPVYLGYFFVALSINDIFTLLFIYAMVWALTALLNTYFNPVFILFKYHYYQVTTSTNTQLFVICKSNERNPQNVKFDDLRRINNRTYISHGGNGK